MHVTLETPGGSGLYLSYNVIAWMFIVVFIALGCWQITLKHSVAFARIHLYTFVGFIFLLIPLSYGYEFSDHAIPRILGLAAGILLLFALSQFDELKQNPQQILWWILIAVAIQSCFGLVQYFILEAGDWAGYKPGINRPHGSFMQPNVMASFMATGFAISLYLSVSSKQCLLNKYQTFLCCFCLFSATFLLVILQSRTGYIASISSLILISMYVYSKNKKQFVINLLITGIAIFSALISFNNSDVVKRGVDIYQKVGARSEIYSITTQMIIDKPISGYGYGNFERSYLDFSNKLKLQNPDSNNPMLKLAHPHNEILFWVSEGGIAALIGMLFFIIAYLNSWIKITNKQAKRLAILGLIMPLLLHSQLEFPFYSSAAHWLVFILLLWYTDVQSHIKQYCLAIKKTFILRFIAILLTVIFLPFLVTTLHTGMIITAHEKNGYQDIKSFKSIINPIAWQSRLDANVYSHILVTGLKNHEPQKLLQYIDWALIRVSYKPRAGLYSNILLCLRVLGKHQQYQQVLIEAQTLYPLIKVWGENLKQNDNS